MDLLDLITMDTNNYYKIGFNDFHELTTLAKNYKWRKEPLVKVLEEGLSRTYYNDFFRLLHAEFNLEKKYHILVMVYNGLTSPYQYKGETKIYIPDVSEMDEILRQYYKIKEERTSLETT